jgi:hypothetical protein
MTQPVLIQSIIKDVGLITNSNGKSDPSHTTKIMTNWTQSPPHNESWSYRGVIGKLN